MRRVVWVTLANIFIIWTITYTTYNNALHGDWVYDDNFAVVNNQDILPSTPLLDLLTHDFWGQDIAKPDSHKSYRPLTVLTFRLNYALHGMDTYGYHLTNIILHCVVSTMVYALSHMLFSDYWISLASGLLFGLHPIHTEAVSSIVGRAEPLCAVFYLLAIFAFQQVRAHHANWGLSWLLHACYIMCFVFATLSKETGYTVLGMLFFQHMLLPRNISNSSIRNGNTHKEKRRMLLQTLIVLGCCGMSYVLLRTWLTTTFTLHNFRNLENPIAFASSRLVRCLSTAHLHAKYLSLLLLPINLSADYSFNAIPLVESITDLRNIRTLLAYTGVVFAILFSFYGVYTKKRESGTILWLLLFGILSFLPASNLFFYVGTMLAERLLYIPSIPFCILIAWASVRTARAICGLSTSSSLRFVLAFMVVMSTFSLGGWYAWRTHTRNLDWQGEKELFISAVQECPGSAKIWQNMGILHRRTQEWSHALEAFSLARKIEPNYCELDYWEGITYLNMGKPEIALKTLLNSVSCVYTQVEAVTALNKIYAVLLSSSPNNSKHLQEWASVLEKIERTHESAYYYLQASIQLQNQGKHNQSAEILHHTLSLLSKSSPLQPTSPPMSKEDIACQAHMWLGAAYLNMNSENLTKAVEHLRYVAGVETIISPVPFLKCGSTISKQGRQALAGLYASLIQKGHSLDTRSRLELAILLVEIGNIQAAHYQVYLVAEDLLTKEHNLVLSCHVLSEFLLLTRQWETQPSYQQLHAWYTAQCPPTNNLVSQQQQKQQQSHKDEL